MITNLPATIDNYVELVYKGLRSLEDGGTVKAVPAHLRTAVKEKYDEKYGAKEVSAE